MWQVSKYFSEALSALCYINCCWDKTTFAWIIWIMQVLHMTYVPNVVRCILFISAFHQRRIKLVGFSALNRCQSVRQSSFVSLTAMTKGLGEWGGRWCVPSCTINSSVAYQTPQQAASAWSSILATKIQKGFFGSCWFVTFHLWLAYFL